MSEEHLHGFFDNFSSSSSTASSEVPEDRPRVDSEESITFSTLSEALHRQERELEEQGLLEAQDYSLSASDTEPSRIQELAAMVLPACIEV